MSELRLLFTALPVGPRGKATLVRGGRRWFALHLAGAFDVQPDRPGDEVAHLWPWILLDLAAGGKIELGAWIADDGKAPKLVERVQVARPQQAGFAKEIQKRIVQTSTTGIDGVDLRWLHPGEAGTPVDEEKSFAARLKYLSTLPGDVAVDLGARIYFELQVESLYDPDADWAPRAKRLWIAPSEIKVAGKVAKVTASPDWHATATKLLVHRYTGADRPAAAFGPGFELAKLTAAPDAKAAFDLTTYWLGAQAGDSRYAEIESLLVDALDPFQEIDALSVEIVRNEMRLGLDDGRAVEMPAEVARRLTELWRVQALGQALQVGEVRAIVARLALRLGAESQLAAKIAAAVSTQWLLTGQAPSGENLRHLATGIGLSAQRDVERVGQVSHRAGSAAIAAWIVEAIESALGTLAQSGIDVRAIRERWNFEESQRRDRRLALARAVLAEDREQRAPNDGGQVRALLDELKSSGTDDAETTLRAAVSKRLRGRWSDADHGRRDPRDIVAALRELVDVGANVKVLLAKDDAIDGLIQRHLDAVWPSKRQPRRSLPRRGIPLLIGRPALRWIHEKNPEVVGGNEGVDNGLFGEVAGVALLARRGKTAADVLARPWRLVTAGVAMAGRSKGLFPPASGDDWKQENAPLAVPMRPVFQADVLRADVLYDGQPMLTQSALELAYRGDQIDGEEDGEPFGAAYTFQSVGPLRAKDAWKPIAAATAAPVLRHGDVYQFAAAVIDQAGGLPKSLAKPDRPWRVAIEALGPNTDVGVDPDRIETLSYRRAVAVGPLNLRPGPDGKGDWPSVDKRIRLRCREWWSALYPKADDASVLLLDQAKRLGLSAEFDALLDAPAIDEFTLMDWAAPALDPENGAARTKLLDAVSAILTARSLEQMLPVHDPAATHLGARVTVVDAKGKVAAPVLATAIPWDAKHFVCESIPIKVKAVPFADSAKVVLTSAQILVELPEGQFASLELWPLVPEGELPRFVPREILADAIDEHAPYAGFCAFRPTVVLLEVATDRMPNLDADLAALKLADEAGNVSVRYAPGVEPDGLQFVDRFVLDRERWVWRNRPVVWNEHVKNAGTNDERRRLAASGPPKDAFTAARDGSADVALWESLAVLDNGFASRGTVDRLWPRRSPTSRDGHPQAGDDAGGSRPDVLLLLDGRDGVPAADYLRYRLDVVSRYAPLLAAAKSPLGHERYRRIAVPHRGGVPKPPKVLAVIPLTAHLRSNPYQADQTIEQLAAAQPTPFLVLLDEVWFREYGVGERLLARIALEKPDPQESAGAKLPYRVGPLPDHHLPPRPFTTFVTQAEEAAAEAESDDKLWLDVFGPFGYSLDVDADQALANASAFVVYPHADVVPWSAMFVRFRRKLDRPSAGTWSEPSAHHALYTVGSATGLARDTGRSTNDGDRPLARLTRSESLVRLQHLAWTLDPTGGKDGKNSAAASQYRYFLLISRLVRDASANLDVELPTSLWRLDVLGNAAGYVAPGRAAVEFDDRHPCRVTPLPRDVDLPTDGRYQARVLEVLLNGRYPGRARLDDATDFRDFWRRLLSADVPGPDGATEYPGQDAAGTIVRVSHAFDLQVI